MNRNIIQLKRRIKRFKKKHGKNNKIRQMQDNLACALHTAKDYYFKISLPNFIKNDPDKFWQYIKETKKPVTQISVHGKPVTDHSGIAQHFNNCLQSVFSGTTVSARDCTVPQPSDVSFVSYAGVFNMLLNLKAKSSCCPDEIPNIFLKRYAELLAKFLVILFRASLMTAQLPSDWKTAWVVPVFKKGDRSLIQNYRPISLTSQCC